MAEYIEREAVFTLLAKVSDGYLYIEVETEHLMDRVRAIPAADVKPVVRGKWIPDDETGLPICSKCFSGKPKSCVCTSAIDHHLHDREIRYCYFCGADMRETHP